MTGWAAVLNNGLGRYQDAFAAACNACEYEDLGIHGWCLSELIEAAARSGEHRAATAAARRLDERAGASGTDFGLGFAASARALVEDDELADSLHTEAVERLGRTRMVIHFARARLRYGEWLRRANRRVDARHQLNGAYQMYTRMGAPAFADRARRELVATGEKVTTKPIGSGSELTAQETQIAPGR